MFICDLIHFCWIRRFILIGPAKAFVTEFMPVMYYGIIVVCYILDFRCTKQYPASQGVCSLLVWKKQKKYLLLDSQQYGKNVEMFCKTLEVNLISESALLTVQCVWFNEKILFLNIEFEIICI